MSATFEIKVTGLRAGNVGDLVDVIRKVEFVVTGAEAEQKFSLPQTVDLAEPEAGSFKALAAVTEADVISWIESNFAGMDGVKAHIQYVLDKEVAKAALTSKPLPWVAA